MSRDTLTSKKTAFDRYLSRHVVGSRRTAFDKYVDRRMTEPEFAAAYTDARAIIDSTDAFVRALEKARLLEGVSKAALARQMDTRPEVVRRLLTAPDSNPTLATVLKLADALGFHLELVRNDSTEAATAGK